MPISGRASPSIFLLFFKKDFHLPFGAQRINRFSPNLHRRCTYLIPFIDQKHTFSAHFPWRNNVLFFWHKKGSMAPIGGRIGSKLRMGASSLGATFDPLWRHFVFGPFLPSYPATACINLQCRQYLET